YSTLHGYLVTYNRSHSCILTALDPQFARGCSWSNRGARGRASGGCSYAQVLRKTGEWECLVLTHCAAGRSPDGNSQRARFCCGSYSNGVDAEVEYSAGFRAGENC